MGFEPDNRIQQIAEAYSLDAIDLARSNFGVALDWSDSSVEKVEAMLGELHKTISEAKPSAEQILQFAKTFGSYLGEVFRRNHGARWGMVTLEGRTFPGMQANEKKAEFWPWGKTQNRLVNGAEDNVWHYFQTLIAEDRAKA